ncbi:MAG: hypothetical protein CMG66_06175 [Candidatus Marinimicrobia bacterium]|nr:hypothetical protein [Candidatus Neomarinimicrobiota bacterium]|tara:strand:- start:21587 stop:22261 length:675 start_codon:yes stop_codon:yes gene_type:complete
MKIKKILLSIFMFVLLSCNEKQIWQEIETGKTIKIFPESININNQDYIYKWSIPKGPENSNFDYSIENDKMLFTPFTIGEYQISLEIKDKDDKEIHNENFYFNAIKGNYDTAKSEKKSIDIKKIEKKVVSKQEKQKETIKEKKSNSKYTIQVASWTSLNKAKEDMNELIELGFDTYIEEYFDKKNNIQRWRVRIGSFKNKELAQKVKNKLSKFRGENPWIAYIK